MHRVTPPVCGTKTITIHMTISYRLASPQKSSSASRKGSSTWCEKHVMCMSTSILIFTTKQTMRFKSNTQAYNDLQERLEAARETYKGLDENALTDKLEEVRDAYVKEIRKKYKMGIH